MVFYARYYAKLEVCQRCEAVVAVAWQFFYATFYRCCCGTFEVYTFRPVLAVVLELWYATQGRQNTIILVSSVGGILRN